MAVANVELGGITFRDASGFSLRGPCARSEALTISGSAATLATAVTSAEARNGVEVVTVSANDTACYYAIGTTPDPDALTQTPISSARRLLAAGLSVDHRIGQGEKVAVKAIA